MFLDILGNMDSDEGTIEINPELFLWAQSLNQIGIDAALSNINFVPDMRTRIAAGVSISIILYYFVSFYHIIIVISI